MAASNVEDYPQLLKILETDQKIVYLCGTGVSMSLGTHGLSWSNWIIAGKDYLSANDQAELDKKIGSGKADELIDAATFLLEKLKANGSYTSFMTGTIGSLHPVNQSFKAALQKVWRAGDLIATTNYDLTIEEAVEAPCVSYSKPAEIFSVIRGGENKVIHLHGVYDHLHGIDDIVADDPQYRKILANDGAQFIQNLISTHPLVIVGCGGTVEDPNLSGFMSFVVEKLGAADVPYFYLLRNGDAVPNLPANAVPVFYGDDHQDLPVFLSELALLRLRGRAGLRTLMSVNPYPEHSPATSAFGRMHFSNGFNAFVGREDEILRLNGFLADGKRLSWWSVLGEGGIGKSRLVLEWLRHMPSHWFGFFTYKNPEAARAFIPFTDTVIVFDYVLGNERRCAETISAYFDAFEDTAYKLRILLIERNQGSGESNWLLETRRALDAQFRVKFEAGSYDESLVVKELSTDSEIVYTGKYLQSYLPLLPATDFVQNCKADISGTSRKIEEAFRLAIDPACYRPLYLSIFIEVWINKEGKLSFKSIEDLLSEYLNKEKDRWMLIFRDDDLVDSYLRLLAVACAIGCFNITDVYGNNYLEEDEKKLTKFLDKQSGKPGANNTFTDLFISMDELVEDDGEDPIAEAFADPSTEIREPDGEEIGCLAAMGEDERFAYYSPYIKLHADPHEVYLQMLADAGAAEKEKLDELKRVREERIKRAENLPDHAWIIEPVFPDIIKEYIVSYAVNDRDIIRFTKLARSNSILELADFIIRALEDWKEKKIFQNIAVTPPDEMLNYFEYYISLMARLYETEDLFAVEQALIDSDPCFSRYEMELWRRIAIVLADRGDSDRLYNSGCRFIEYLDSIDGMVPIREEAADVMEGYCVGLHNADVPEKYEAFLAKCDEIAQRVPDNARLGEVLCESYRFLMNAKLYHNRDADVGPEWGKIKDYIERYDYRETMCRKSMEAAYDFMITVVGKKDLNSLYSLENFLEKAFAHAHIVEIAEIAALCCANIFSITYSKTKTTISGEREKIRRYYDAYPKSKHIRAAYLVTSRVTYLETSTYRKVPDKLLNNAKAWVLQYPEEIEFPEGYFGLLLARFEYAQAHDMRNEQRRLFKEMKTVAERTDYSEYQEANSMLETVDMLQRIYGYR